MSGRNVMVTGGTGALGRAVVGAFLADGDRVIAPWVVPQEAESARETWRNELASGRLVLVEADVSEEPGALRAVEAAGDVAVLVNGVGGFAGGTPLDQTPLEVWDRMYRMNVRTAAACAHAALPKMRARKGGVIVNVASQAAFAPPAGLAAYAASKAGVVALTKSLQEDVAALGIRVAAVVPTTIDTPANRAAMPKADFSAWTPPAKIAGVILWLASDAASTVRGALIPV
ncbi:MAG TPA: SDR family NAD(P)-dependent oxidoreductase [Myxococcota bacterium]|nr:SDR family NAD(P)-dependent oxidoreductase [Myxococcota bacterium]